MLRFAEHLLASAIGAASSRLVLSLLLRRRNLSTEAALQLLDDASAAIQYNRDLLQTALDNARQGISVFDRDLRLRPGTRPSASSRTCRPTLVRVGIGLDEIVRHNAARGAYGPATTTSWSAERLQRFVNAFEPFQTRLHPSEKVIEIRPNPMPDGGVVTTYTDITEAVAAAEELERANESLEQRVRERTEELERAQRRARARQGRGRRGQPLQDALPRRREPRHPAAAQRRAALRHDPGRAQRQAARSARLAENVDASLDAVEEILGALLDISRLDAGAMRPETTSFRDRRADAPARRWNSSRWRARRGSTLRLRAVERHGPLGPAAAAPAAAEPRLQRHQVHAGRPRAGRLPARGAATSSMVVADTGLGIPKSKQRTVFREFQRLEQGASVARGLGLGLSIVERIARVLGHAIVLRSEPGRGTVFSVRRAAGCGRSRRVRRRADRGHAHGRPASTASSCSPSTTSRRSSTAWRRC